MVTWGVTSQNLEDEGGGKGRGKRREEEGRDAYVGVPFEFKDEVVVIGHARTTSESSVRRPLSNVEYSAPY